jgi:hypothetical protein
MDQVFEPLDDGIVDQPEAAGQAGLPHVSDEVPGILPPSGATTAAQIDSRVGAFVLRSSGQHLPAGFDPGDWENSARC